VKKLLYSYPVIWGNSILGLHFQSAGRHLIAKFFVSENDAIKCYPLIFQLVRAHIFVTENAASVQMLEFGTDMPGVYEFDIPGFLPPIEVGYRCFGGYVGDVGFFEVIANSVIEFGTPVAISSDQYRLDLRRSEESALLLVRATT
jgi:hypothetical protein